MDLTHVRFQGTPLAPSRQMGDRWTPVRPAPAGTAVPERASAPIGALPTLVLAQAGLDPASYRETPLRRRTPACLRAVRADSVTSALSRVTRDPRLADLALNALLIGVSEFFRDPMVFRTLQTVVVPALERRNPVRIVSIGCSFGAELYSVAMLLAQSGVLDRSYLLGVDCRPAAVSLARHGLFAGTALAGLDQRLRSRFFEPTNGGWRVVSALQQHTEWRILDATRDCPPGPWDVVLCRNVAIYLQNHAADAMFHRLARQLAPGGFVVVGNAERPPAPLKFAQVGRCVYRNS